MLASTLKQQFEASQHDKRLAELYVDPVIIDFQRTRYISALNEFIKIWGDQSVEILSAPGRSEVCGNHTDHQKGMVLAAAVNMDIIAIAAATEGKEVHMVSKGYGEIKVNLSSLSADKREEGKTESLIRGVAAGLAVRDFNVGGFNAYVTSQVPAGAGLSSSAAFEVLVGNIFAVLHNNNRIKPVTIAQVGMEAENKFFGKPCGLMDQMTSSIGGLVHIDFENPDNPKTLAVDVDFDSFDYSMCIVDTKGSHSDLTDDYAAIPAEMKKVAKFFDKEVLREVSEEDFYKNINEIRKFAGDRAVLRAIHWFDEEKRVVREVEALQDDNFTAFDNYVRESGQSSYRLLQNAYSSKNSAAQGICIGIAMTERILGHKAGCRIHGGGFAGTIQVFVPNSKVPGYKKEIEKLFGEGSCHVLKVRNPGGCKVV
ncbi:MAG: galactokinase [Lachnospiraceae bacterium]|jgi:galactokinase|nr:galactokinase [Lachnospiraceae bacterium]